MKRFFTSLLSVFALIISFQSSIAQTADGNFEGALDVNGVKLDMHILLETIADKLTGNLDIPAQGVKGMKLADVKLSKSKLEFKLPEVPGGASYTGAFNTDFTKIDGIFSQAGMELPLVFVKMDDAIIAAKAENLKKIIEDIRQRKDIPAIGVGIVKNGKVIMAEGFGERDINQGLKADANTLFAIGSSSKAFTTMGLGMLADKGQLDWDEPIRTYMPDFELMDEFATQEMNAVDLVCHRSGLPRHDLMWYGSGFSREDLFNKLGNLEPSEPFRTKFQYNNLMFMTAGLLIEDISGMSWEDFTKKNIFDPLGMTSSNFSVDAMTSSDNAALGYTMDEDEVKYMPYRNIDQIGPAGSINSNVNDMVKWIQLHLNKGKVDSKEIINSAQIDKMHEPHMVIAKGSATSPEIQSINYGLGWFTRVYDGIYTVEHGGNIDGFSALVYLQPSKDLGIVILTNMNGTSVPAVISNTIVDELLDLDERDWYTRVYGEENEDEEEEKDEKEIQKYRAEGTTPTKPLTEYVGIYEHPSYGKIIVSMNGQSLHYQKQAFESDLEHWHYDLFKADFEALGEVEVYFSIDKNGEIVGLNSTLDPLVDDIHFAKLPPDYLNDPEYLAKLAGEYDLDGTMIKIEVVADELKATIPGQPQYTLEPFKETTFNIQGLNGFSVEFVLDKNKKEAKSLKFIQPNGIFEATKK